MKQTTKQVRAHLEMFEKHAEWLTLQMERARPPFIWHTRQEAQELQARYRQLHREYTAWLTKPGIYEEVAAIAAFRRLASGIQ